MGRKKSSPISFDSLGQIHFKEKKSPLDDILQDPLKEYYDQVQKISDQNKKEKALIEKETDDFFDDMIILGKLKI